MTLFRNRSTRSLKRLINNGHQDAQNDHLNESDEEPVDDELEGDGVDRPLPDGRNETVEKSHQNPEPNALDKALALTASDENIAEEKSPQESEDIPDGHDFHHLRIGPCNLLYLFVHRAHQTHVEDEIEDHHGHEDGDTGDHEPFDVHNSLLWKGEVYNTMIFYDGKGDFILLQVCIEPVLWFSYSGQGLFVLFRVVRILGGKLTRKTMWIMGREIVVVKSFSTI